MGHSLADGRAFRGLSGRWRRRVPTPGTVNAGNWADCDSSVVKAALSATANRRRGEGGWPISPTDQGVGTEYVPEAYVLRRIWGLQGLYGPV